MQTSVCIKQQRKKIRREMVSQGSAGRLEGGLLDKPGLGGEFRV